MTLVVAVSLATLSLRLERVGPTPVNWDQELCAPEPLHPCAQGVLQGGWPLAFLFDRPGISVMGKLGFFEDLFRLRTFAFDAVVIWLPLWALANIVTRRQRANLVI